MHVHANQPTPNLQLDALYAAQKASAKSEVERTRRKLMESASKLSAQAKFEDAAVVRLRANEDSHERDERQNRQNPSSQEPATQQSDIDNSISDWA
jgi:hypothetical protein